MKVIIPLGGKGVRFKDNGYTKPKALIRVFGKYIISYVIECIKNIDIVIPYNTKEYEKYNLEYILKKEHPNKRFYFIKLNHDTNGAAETLYLTLSNLITCSYDFPFVSYDCDNYFVEPLEHSEENSVYYVNKNNPASIYSFLEINDDKKIIKLVEKDNISDNVCCGVYSFVSATEFIKAYESIKKNKDERYISHVINEMMKTHDFKAKEVNDKKWKCLGTPLQVYRYYNNMPVNTSITNERKIMPKRICFDLDNTLVTNPVINGDYTTVRPIKRMIEYCNYLKRIGNTIIIYTARRMKTHYGNTGKVLTDIGKITFETLDKYGIEYDEIYFGKPYADFYIDDSAINPQSNDVEKETGYYMNVINPRSTNSIEYQDNIVIKNGECVLSEIYYYNNIPKEIKDIFPVLHKYDENEKSMNIEKINGVNISHLFINELLTEYTFEVILNTLDRIHKNHTTDDINIYQNYTSKLKKRYDETIYSRYSTSCNDIYEELICKLDKYEINNKGIKTLIHGDPVFTNIFVNENEKIKMIDPRGKIGDIYTIYGDCNYDRAKILQSLIGYDEVLQDKYVSEEYRNVFLRIFKQRYDNYDEIALITKSLLFSLIPLHDETKRVKFYELINSKYL